MNLTFSKLATSNRKTACLKHRCFSEPTKLIIIAMDTSYWFPRDNCQWPNEIAVDLQEDRSGAQWDTIRTRCTPPVHIWAPRGTGSRQSQMKAKEIRWITSRLPGDYPDTPAIWQFINKWRLIRQSRVFFPHTDPTQSISCWPKLKGAFALLQTYNTDHPNCIPCIP